MLERCRPYAGLCAGMALLLTAALAGAAQPSIDPLAVEGPVALEFPVAKAAGLPALVADPIDLEAARNEDRDREGLGLAPRFALPQAVSVSPENAGVWEDLDSRFQLWRHRISAPGALSVNLGFSAYRLPKGARLSIYPVDATGPDDPRGVRTFTDGDNETHGELWTPVILGDEIVIELVLPSESRHDYRLELASINRGYRFFGEDLADLLREKSGSCNVDVICPEGDDWRAEIASVGVISTGGSTFCTGFMVNNTAQDASPYFMTANHCGINVGNAPSLVVYWNFQSPVCGQQGGGSLADFQTGSTWLAGNATSDFTLVEMDDPVDPEHAVAFAGWNNGSEDPQQAIAIHHPNTDEKSISFEFDPTSTTSYLSNAVPGNGTHIRVTDWDVGTTEPGSSGSPLFDENHRVVGQLHGGYAACGNDLSDWYGRFSVSWPALAPYLDPTGSGAAVLDTWWPGLAGMKVTPSTGFYAEGEVGGPFANPQQDYVIKNLDDAPLQFVVDVDASWLTVDPASGTVPEGGEVTVTVALTPDVFGLPQGTYTGTIAFTNLTDGLGDTTRDAVLQVGLPELAYSFPLDTDPGWIMETGWQFGVPQGGGGAYGGPDPVSGHTGANVLGFNLAGDYPNNLPLRSLRTGAIDCSGLEGVTVKFQRWLGVEQPSYDHAYFSVSNDGVNWTTVWQNTGEVADTEWTLVEYDISAVADGRATVYLAWTMGPTDASWTYCGWNLDDIEIWGRDSSPSDLVLTVTPHAAPISIPANGGTFAYEVMLESTDQVTFGAVIDAVLPNGNVYTVRRLPTRTLQAGTHVWPNVSQDVPAGAPAGTYLYRISLATADGRTASDSFTFEKSSVAKGNGLVTGWDLYGLGDEDGGRDLPAGFALHGAAPNPFNPRTVISFDLPRTAAVSLDVYDVAGRLVRRLIDGETMPAGTRSAVWDGRDGQGRGAAAGVYFYRLQADGFSGAGRMLLVK
ncbi:trypsin-like peptidase domain-containing protein [bacterium]|nr:trypsin-like peptidase domain-containing protein [bacterium]